MDSGAVFKEYFKNWPKKTSKYVQDLEWALAVGVQYLDKVKLKPSTGKPRCVVFDFDDCLVFGDPTGVVGVKEMELGTQDGHDIFILPRNEQVVMLAEHAKKNGFQVIILTARPAESKEATKWNSQMLKIPHDAIITNDSNVNFCFKAVVRKRIAEKYDIVLTVGDRITDCIRPGGRAGFIKLPDPGEYNKETNQWICTSLASYAWIPN